MPPQRSRAANPKVRANNDAAKALGNPNIVGVGAGNANPPAAGPATPKTQKEAGFSDDGANTAQMTQNTPGAAVGTANTRYTANGGEVARFAPIAPTGWRREANTKRGIWYWRQGSGDLRGYLPGGKFDDLPEDLQQRSINYGEQQRQQKAKAAAKRANRQ